MSFASRVFEPWPSIWGGAQGGGAPPSPYEDFTTFTEVDPNGHIVVNSATGITVTGIALNEDAYVYKDYGVDYFNLFTHETRMYNGTSGGSCKCLVWGVSDTVNDFQNWASPYGKIYIMSGSLLYLATPAGTDSYSGLSFQHTYHLTIVHADNDTLTCYLYYDEAKTDLRDTLVVTLDQSATMRYLYAVASSNEGYSWTQNAWTGYFDITP